MLLLIVTINGLLLTFDTAGEFMKPAFLRQIGFDKAERPSHSRKFASSITFGKRQVMA